MVGVGFPKPGLFSQMCLKWSIEHWTLAFIIYYQPVLKKTHGFREETFTNEGFKVVAALEQRPRIDRYFQLRPLGAGVVGVEGGSEVEQETCWETFRVQTCSPLFWPFLSWLCRRKARLTQLAPNVPPPCWSGWGQEPAGGPHRGPGEAEPISGLPVQVNTTVFWAEERNKITLDFLATAVSFSCDQNSEQAPIL